MGNILIRVKVTNVTETHNKAPKTDGDFHCVKQNAIVLNFLNLVTISFIVWNTISRKPSPPKLAALQKNKNHDMK